MAYFELSLSYKNNDFLFMNYEGVLTKMQTENGSPIQYYLVFENDFLNVNQLLNKKVSISFVSAVFRLLRFSAQ